MFKLFNSEKNYVGDILNLVDNGLDSLRKALIALFDMGNKKDSEEFALKDIVINFHHSIEVLFKHLVSEKNIFLIYENQEDVFRFHANEKMNRKKQIEDHGRNNKVKKRVDIRTINFIDCLNRVIVLYNVDIDQYTYNQFKELNNLRNALTHHECELNVSEVEHLVAHVLPVVTEMFKYIEKFNKFIADEKMTLEIRNLYNKRYIWKFVTLIRLTEKSNYDIDFYDPEDLHLLGFDKRNLFSEDNYIKQSFEDLVFSSVNKKFFLSLKENTKLSAWLSEKKEVIRDLAIRTMHEKISIAMYYVLREAHQNMEEIIENKNLKFLKLKFKQSELRTKIAIADCMNVIKKMISDLKEFMLVEEVCNKKFVFRFNDKFPTSDRLLSKIELEFSINEYLGICENSLRDNQFLYTDSHEQNEFTMIKNFIDNIVYEEVQEGIQDSILDGDISILLRDTWGEHGYVDRISEFEFWTSYVVKSSLKDSYYLILLISVSTETYNDHEYYYNGSVEFYLGLQILINWEEKSVKLKDISFIDFCNGSLFIT